MMPAATSVRRALKDAGVVPYDPTNLGLLPAHYRHGRLPYSPELEAALTSGCGPRVLSVRLAYLFELGTVANTQATCPLNWEDTARSSVNRP